MKKGSERRQAILDTAERLFFEHGYEQTSIQEILDALSLSKGGFYHHFDSKAALLEAICLEYAENACGRGVEAASDQSLDPVVRLNDLFLQGGFFAQTNTRYVLLMLRAAYAGETLRLRACIRETTLKRFSPVVAAILEDGMRREVFYLRTPVATARLLVLLACDVTDEIAQCIAAQRGEDADIAGIIDLLDAYRRAVELLIDAPYGSIELIDLRRVDQLMQALDALAGSEATRP